MTLTPLSTSVAERRPAKGILDTSVIVDLGSIDPELLPHEIAVSALTLAEFTAGTHSGADSAVSARRQGRLQYVEATFEAVAFDTAAARAYGQIYAAVANARRKPRGSRAVDVLIAATACANNLPLYTRNPRDFEYLDGLVEVISI